MSTATCYALNVFEKSISEGLKSSIHDAIVTQFATLTSLHECFRYAQAAQVAQASQASQAAQAAHAAHGNANARQHHSSMRKGIERPKIGVRDFSKVEMMKKDLRANLNKISPANVSTIVKNVKNIYHAEYQEAYIDVIVDFMINQPDYQPLFISIIQDMQVNAGKECGERRDALDKHISGKFLSYIASTYWMVDGIDVEDLTNRVKWKSRVSAITKCLIAFQQQSILPEALSISCQTLFGTIVDQLDAFFLLSTARTAPSVSYEVLLEQLQVFLANTTVRLVSDAYRGDLSSRFKAWEGKVNDLPYSIIKYKFLDMKDGLCK